VHLKVVCFWFSMSHFGHKFTFETLDIPSNKSLYSQTKIIKVLSSRPAYEGNGSSNFRQRLEDKWWWYWEHLEKRPWEFEENMGNALRTHWHSLKIRWEHIGNIKILKVVWNLCLKTNQPTKEMNLWCCKLT
jgi:hypothetical protein